MSFDPDTLSVDDLEGVVNPCDVRRDLHTFVTYFGDHGVTRTYRENLLPKNHALRLAKRLTDPEAAEEIKAGGQSEWLDYVDRLGLQLKLVRYNTKGVYVGHSSSSESYPDNDVFFEDSRYERFLRLSLQAQEAQILTALLNDCGYDKNEFLEAGPFSRLDRFDYSGCAAGVMPTLRFAKVRRYLLDLLAQCESGVWYSVASLVEHLKANDPFFLIPEALPKKVLAFERELQSWVGRSENFVLYEGFGLLEGNIEALEARPFVIERISPSLAVVATPRTLHDSLEAAERIPIVVRHTESALRPALEGAASVFAVKRRKAAIGRKRAAIVKRSVRITLHFPTRGLFDAFLKTLLDAQCVLPSDARAMTFSYSKEQEKAVASILREFKKKHAVRLEEIA